MTTINPLTTDVDAFVDAIEAQMDEWIKLRRDYDLADYCASLSDAYEYLEGNDTGARRHLVELAAYAAIIWHALGENQVHKEVDYAT